MARNDVVNKDGSINYDTIGGFKDQLDTHTTQLAEMLLQTDIKGTSQNITKNADGTVQMIQHVDGSSNVLRTDSFAYTTNLITEVRTLNTSQTVTFKYHLDTLQTEVI